MRIPSLFLLGNVFQSLGLSYDYAGHSGTGTPAVSINAFRERYSLSSDFAIRDPHLLSVLFSAGLTYSQNFGSQQFKMLDWDYDIEASAFDLSYHPATFSTTRNSNIISDGYTPTYSLTQNSNKLTLALMNNILPVQLFYGHDTLSTSGLATDTTTVADTVNLNMHHDIADLSHTQFSLGYSAAHVIGSDQRGYLLSLTNNLMLDKAHRYTLDTSIQANDSMSAGIPQNNYSVGENLNCQFGAGLSGVFTDQYTYNSTLDYQNNTQSSWSNALTGTLSHHLFNSLNTSVTGFFTDGGLLGGTQRNYGGALMLNYNKLLPSQSLLSLNASDQKQYTEQNLANTQFLQRDEPHKVTDVMAPIQLNMAGKLLTGVSIRSLTAQSTYIDYVENIDYTVDYQLNQVHIILGRIPANITLLITYSVELNPKVSFLTDTKNLGANLALLNGHYNLGATLSIQDQSLISGQATNQALISSTVLESHADVIYTHATLGAEYGIFDSSMEKYSHLGAHWNWVTSYTNQDTASFNIVDTYTMFPTTGTTSSTGYNQNAATFATTYGRRLLEFIHMDLALSVSDERQSNFYTDFILFRAGFTGAYNQLVFALNGQTMYRFAGGSTNTDNSVHFSITRTF